MWNCSFISFSDNLWNCGMKIFHKVFFFFSFILKLITGIEEMFFPLWHFLCAHKHTPCVSRCCGVWAVISSVSVWWAAATLSFYSCKFMDAPRHTGHMQIGRGGFYFGKNANGGRGCVIFVVMHSADHDVFQEMFPDLSCWWSLMSLCHYSVTTQSHGSLLWCPLIQECPVWQFFFFSHDV